MDRRQQALPSGLGANTTAREALQGQDLSGRVAIVTGGYSGLGLETVRILAGAGAQVIVPARDAAKADAALRGMAGVQAESLDLMDPASISGFAERFLQTRRPLHLLVNSAGVMAPPLARDGRGYESQFATNHLGHFHLTALLWPALERAQGARVVSVSSRGHRIAPVDFEDPHFERRAYDKWQAYGQSKTANALFALGLDLRGEAHGVRAFSLHPGSILTPLARHMNLDDLRRVGVLDDNDEIRPKPEAGFKSVEQGAATSVWCAVSPQLAGRGGVYCEDCDVAPVVAGATGPGVHPWASDPALAERLWALSEAQTGVVFAPLATAAS